MNRVEAIHKLLLTIHLDVNERRVFGSEPLHLSELVQEIGNIVATKGRYPLWDAEEEYSGVLIQRQGDGYFLRHKVESGVCRYTIVKEELHKECSSAATYAVRHMFSNGIDGVPVEWH